MSGRNAAWDFYIEVPVKAIKGQHWRRADYIAVRFSASTLGPRNGVTFFVYMAMASFHGLTGNPKIDITSDVKFFILSSSISRRRNSGARLTPEASNTVTHISLTLPPTAKRNNFLLLPLPPSPSLGPSLSRTVWWFFTYRREKEGDPSLQPIVKEIKHSDQHSPRCAWTPLHIQNESTGPSLLRAEGREHGHDHGQAREHDQVQAADERFANTINYHFIHKPSTHSYTTKLHQARSQKLHFPQSSSFCFQVHYEIKFLLGNTLRRVLCISPTSTTPTPLLNFLRARLRNNACCKRLASGMIRLSQSKLL